MTHILVRGTYLGNVMKRVVNRDKRVGGQNSDFWGKAMGDLYEFTSVHDQVLGVAAVVS